MKIHYENTKLTQKINSIRNIGQTHSNGFKLSARWRSPVINHNLRMEFYLNTYATYMFQRMKCLTIKLEGTSTNRCKINPNPNDIAMSIGK